MTAKWSPARVFLRNAPMKGGPNRTLCFRVEPPCFRRSWKYERPSLEYRNLDAMIHLYFCFSKQMVSMPKSKRMFERGGGGVLQSDVGVLATDYSFFLRMVHLPVTHQKIVRSQHRPEKVLTFTSELRPN
jgi:hypothetical protein